MTESSERSLARQLFEENDWRVLWWELILHLSNEPDYPRTEADIEMLAYGAEFAVRHLPSPIFQRLLPVARRVWTSRLLDNARSEVVDMIRGFLFESINPLLADDLQPGSWSAQSEGLEDRVLQQTVERGPTGMEMLLRRAARLASVRLWIVWTNPGNARWARGWPSEPGHELRRVPTLSDHVGFANYDLRIMGLPEIEIDGTGRLYVDLDCTDPTRHLTTSDNALGARHEKVMQIVARHGFEKVGQLG
jgi:hypothetical protein